MKKRIRKTGEIVTVICFSGGTDRYENDSVSFVDSNGNERCERGMNYYWDLEDVDETDMKYWEHFRNDAALKILTAKLSNSSERKKDILESISLSIHYANHLVKELMNNNSKILQKDERMGVKEGLQD